MSGQYEVWKTIRWWRITVWALTSTRITVLRSEEIRRITHVRVHQKKKTHEQKKTFLCFFYWIQYISQYDQMFLYQLDYYDYWRSEEIRQLQWRINRGNSSITNQITALQITGEEIRQYTVYFLNMKSLVPESALSCSLGERKKWRKATVSPLLLYPTMYIHHKSGHWKSMGTM